MSFVESGRRRIALALVGAGLFMFSAMPSFSDFSKDASDNYFASLKKDFDKLVANHALKNPRAGSVNGVFVMSLKKHQPIAYLARVNAKGMVLNEVIRGEVPKKKVNRKIGDEAWYSFVMKNQKPFYGFVEDNGRYYLVWADAITAKKKTAFVIGSKIDIWDCFHKLSNDIPQAFLVKIGAKSLYSNKWKTGVTSQEEPLEVPGVDKISLVTEKPAAAARAAETLAASVQRDTSALAAVPAGQSSSLGSASEKPVQPHKHRIIVILISIVVVILLIFLIFRLYAWLNNKFLMRSINKPD